MAEPVPAGQPHDPPAPTAPPPAAPPTPAPPAAAPVQHPSPSAQRAGQELLEAIQALPERIINGLREAAPQQPTKRAEAPPKPQTESTPPPASAKPAVEPGQPPSGTTRLAKWWFS